MEELAKKVISLFDADGRSDAEIENDLGLPRSTIYDWRNGRSKSYRKYIEKISSYYHVNLFQDVKEQKNKPTDKKVSELRPGTQEAIDIIQSLPDDLREAALATLRNLSDIAKRKQNS